MIFTTFYMICVVCLLIGTSNSEIKNNKLMDQTTIALETYYCVNFHVLSDHLK